MRVLYEKYFCGTSVFTVGDDKTVKQWEMDGPAYREEEDPLHMILGKAEKKQSKIITRSFKRNFNIILISDVFLVTDIYQNLSTARFR